MKADKYLPVNALLLIIIFSIYPSNSFAQRNKTKNSINSDKTLLDFNPEFEKIKSRVSYVPGIKVIRGETNLIVPEHESFCPSGSVFKFNNGDILV